MPYKDPEQRRQAWRRSKRRQRERQACPPRGDPCPPPDRRASGGDGVTSRIDGLGGRLADYLRGLTVTQGPLAGSPFEVLPWQGDFLRLWNEPGDLALSVARKNGKTTVLSGIAVATLDGPLAHPRAETVIVAASFSRACIAFRHVRAFMGD